MSAADAAHLTMKAITYFKADSGIRDFLLALLTADRELYQCSHDAPLRSYIQARNLTTFIPDVASGCANLPVLAGNGSNLSGPGAPLPSDSSHDGGAKKSGVSCGLISIPGTSGPANLLAMLFLILIPLAIALV